jgi:tagatose-1,6-bisphosphate aldolase non-catalytic subunit AgaZ/GatZ
LHYVQHAYNRAIHSYTHRYPFETCFGYFPKSPLDFIFGKDSIVDGHSDAEKHTKLIQKIQLVHQAMQEQLEKSQAKYKARHDKHRFDHHFQVSDQVWLYISKDVLKVKVKISSQSGMVCLQFWKILVTMLFWLDLPPYM